MTNDTPVLSADAADGDWIKRGTWDLPAKTVEDLRELLYDLQVPVEQFKQLDVYTANVEKLPWLKAL